MYSAFHRMGVEDQCVVPYGGAPATFSPLSVHYYQGGRSIGMLLRDTLASPIAFTEAVAVLNTTRLIAPVYIILSGVNEGSNACARVSLCTLSE